MSDQNTQRFRDRADAGRQLAAVLDGQSWHRPLVFGIPRGGVAVAAEVARALGAELSVLVVRRLEAPYQPQLTLGAVTADGVAYVNEALVREVGATDSYLRAEQAQKARQARRHEKDFDVGCRPGLGGRTAVVVDEGLVTGSTATAAVRSLKAGGAARVAVAVPVGPPKVLRELRREADEVVCLEEAPDFVAVDRLDGDFHHVDYSEVRQAVDALVSSPMLISTERRAELPTRAGEQNHPGGRRSAGPSPADWFLRTPS